MSSALLVVDAAGDVGDRDDLRAGLVAHPGRDRADVAEALHDDAGSPSSVKPRKGAASRQISMRPRPVASTRPREPPSESGLPVTTDVTVWRACIEYVSMIHAIVWGFVPMSGAGTSFSGPNWSISSAV